ncbi:MAG: polysaccharide biosynthesis/export family protein [Prosthecobacter sp.]|uniref:polysaccharide biosynthesis/export family protein n=1 Tax=Prosthecobacter sp. TaxID=1965333 RepID=UPI001E0A5C5D|nr:polysaccharide biosynthesis/export family protein [Prosthecobacter sp.]MCB1279238.1 polysaccharide biosynthesis/export family protein [Prosthecobacter sp.]
MNLRKILIALFVFSLFSPVRAQNGELALKPNDRITLSIGGIPDSEVAQINKVYTVSDAGTINLLFIGEVRAAGLKPSMLQRSIEQTYVAREIYTRPTVTVSIDGAGGGTERWVYVVSGTNKNGPVPYSSNLTILKAVGIAGGFSPFAKPSRTKLIRNGATQEINLKDISANPSRDILLQPEDQIIVPE